jgi:beta-galactosidase
MRQSIAGQEKFHGAIISHAGHDDTRVFREAERLGKELEQLGDAFLRGRTPAKTAILLDWNNWWALELASGPTKDMDYLKTVSLYYKPLHDRNIPVDFVNPGADTDYSRYALVIAPMLYMTKPGVTERLTDYVRAGGTLIATVMTGLADENDRCVFGEYPGRFRDVLGIWVEETDALRPEESNRMRLGNGISLPQSSYECSFLCDLLHTRTAKALAFYEKDFYAGMPCVTRNNYGMGCAYYIGTQPENAFLTDLLDAVCSKVGISAAYAAEPGLEITERIGERGECVFVLNHTEGPKEADFGKSTLTNLLTDETISGRKAIPGRDVCILKKDHLIDIPENKDLKGGSLSCPHRSN